MWWKIAFLIIVALIAAVGGMTLYGKSHWRVETVLLRERLDATRVNTRSNVFDPRELQGLPDAVQRYFQIVLGESRPIVSAIRVEHTGSFNMNETKVQWKPFTSNQLVITHRPGFDWDARIAMAPFLDVRVHDAYVAGEGVLSAKLLGLVTLANVHGTPEAARGELMRFLAEAAWYPTALLPSQGVCWSEVDASSARATLTDGATTVTLLFRFEEAGLVESVWSADRGRVVNDSVIATPWEGRFYNYERRQGMLIPMDGEVAWLLPDGAKPYWRGHITRIEYEFAN